MHKNCFFSVINTQYSTSLSRLQYVILIMHKNCFVGVTNTRYSTFLSSSNALPTSTFFASSFYRWRTDFLQPNTDVFGFQLIPEISSLSAVTTAVPLFSVLTLTAIKYGYDDIVSIANYIVAFIDYESY